jgi:hypothetical protein
MAQANFEPTFSCINTLTILKPSYYSSYLPAYEDGTDRVFRNVGIQNSDAGELPRREKKHRTFTTRRKFEIKNRFTVELVFGAWQPVAVLGKDVVRSWPFCTF